MTELERKIAELEDALANGLVTKKEFERLLTSLIFVNAN